MSDVSIFDVDLKKGKQGEKIVFDFLQEKLSDRYLVEDVSDDPECYYKGDLTIFDIDAFIDKGKDIDCCTKYVEVKTDDCISDTGNVLCEYSVYYPIRKENRKGNMQNDGDYYAVVSREARKIYWFNFKKLKKIFKFGKNRKISHYDEFGRLSQITNAYLLSLVCAKNEGALIRVFDF